MVVNTKNITYKESIECKLIFIKPYSKFMSFWNWIS